MGQSVSAPGPPETEFRVIAPGLFRTGTKTFAKALSILLGPVHDAGAQGMAGPRETRNRWCEIMRLWAPDEGRTHHEHIMKLLSLLTKGYVSATDIPACFMTKELMELYPDAVVIVTTRDAESWYKSAKFMEQLVSARWLPFVAWPIPGYGSFCGFMERSKEFVQVALHKPPWSDPDTEWGGNTIVEHNERIRELVPPEKLYFYNVKDGWEPLCKILGVPIPDVPFPHENTPEKALQVQRQVLWTGLSLWALIGASVTGMAAVMYRYKGGRIARFF